MRYKKVLVTLDGSELAERALTHAVRITEPDGYILLLTVVDAVVLEEYVHITDLLSSAMNPAVAFQANHMLKERHLTGDSRVIGERLEYLQRVADDLRAQGFKVRMEVCPGAVIPTIISTAAEFDVLVMATHGRTGLSKFLLGSVAEGVLHKSPCPVLLVPARYTV
jgi:nucleotide-binding universal stress UspA family protein